MDFPKLQTSIRVAKGKGPARRLRRDGMVPAVLYGKSVAPIALNASPRDISAALSGPLRANTVIKLSITGAPAGMDSEYNVMVRDYQYDPVSRNLLHVDFLSVPLDRQMKIDIPLKFTGRSVGEQAGGIVTVSYRSIPAECLPEDIPEAIEADITDLNIGDSLTVGSLSTGKGVTLLLSDQTSVVSVRTKKAEVEVKEDVEEGEAAEGAEAETKDAPESEQGKPSQ